MRNGLERGGGGGVAVASIKFYTLWEGMGRDTDRYTPFLIGSHKLDLKRMAPFLGRFSGFTQRALNQPIKKTKPEKILQCHALAETSGRIPSSPR